MDSFFQKKWNILKKINNPKGNLLFVDRGKYYQALILSIAVSAICKKNGLRPIILSDLKNESEITKIYKSLGFNYFVHGYSKNNLFILIYYSIISSFLSIYIFIVTKIKGFKWFINSFFIDDVPIGDLIYDLYIVQNKSYKKKNPNLLFFKVLFLSILRFYIVNFHIKKNKIKFIFCSTEFYSGNNGIAYRIAGIKGIKNLAAFHDSRDQLKIVRNSKHCFKFGPHSHFRNKEIKRVLKTTKFSKNQIEKFYLERKLFKTKNAVTVFTYKKANKNTKYTNKFIKKLKNRKKKIVIFSCHAFSDANHAFGIKFPFTNFYNHLKETIEYIVKNNDEKYLWVIKSHPNSKSKDFIEIKNLIKKFKTNKIVLCPENISTKKLIEISEGVITSKGTMALEAICEGKFAVSCGFVHYSNFDIVNECSTKKEYFKTIKNLDKISKPTKEKILKAKKILYILENDEINHEIINKNFKNRPLENLFKKYIDNKNYLLRFFNKNYKEISNNKDIYLKIGKNIK